jgi:hypothetical protein
MERKGARTYRHVWRLTSRTPRNTLEPFVPEMKSSSLSRSSRRHEPGMYEEGLTGSRPGVQHGHECRHHLAIKRPCTCVHVCDGRDRWGSDDQHRRALRAPACTPGYEHERAGGPKVAGSNPASPTPIPVQAASAGLSFGTDEILQPFPCSSSPDPLRSEPTTWKSRSSCTSTWLPSSSVTSTSK